MARARGFCVTDFILDPTFWGNYVSKTEYVVCGLETCPKTGKQHYQIYMYFKNARSVNAVRKDLSPRHVEIAKGTPEENRKYCTKEGNFTEFGVMPKQGKRVDLEELFDMAAAGAPIVEIADTERCTWARNWRALEKYKSLKEPTRNWVTEVNIYCCRS